MPDGCLFCEGANPMTWMITHLNPPVTIQSCEQDIANNLIGVLSEQLTVDYEWLYDLISNGVNALADEHAAAQAAYEQAVQNMEVMDAPPAEKPIGPQRRTARKRTPVAADRVFEDGGVGRDEVE